MDGNTKEKIYFETIDEQHEQYEQHEENKKSKQKHKINFDVIYMKLLFKIRNEHKNINVKDLPTIEYINYTLNRLPKKSQNEDFIYKLWLYSYEGTLK